MLLDSNLEDKTVKQVLKLMTGDCGDYKLIDYTPEQIDCFYRYMEANKEYADTESVRSIIEKYSSIPKRNFDAIIELSKIPAEKNAWQTYTFSNYGIKVFEKIKTLDDSCIESIVKIGTLMKDGVAVFDNMSLETLMNQDPEYINLIVKRFFETPNADRAHLYTLMLEPLSKLKNPNTVLSESEQALEDTFSLLTFIMYKYI